MKDQEKKGENTKEENIENHQDIKDDSSSIIHISGMYKDWFLDYASYVILERAVPHVYDGLKPVHRRILHAMKRLDDGRYNKVANIIGHTMQFHPHGDASIGDALVQLGQKDLLVDTQGNWGNILTGDSAAAPRYIEARLSKFALEVVFNPKTTFWKASYDGRNKEPIALPVKFPLLLAQGVEGIAVGLSSKILPHNFNELIDASICILKDKEYEIYPDFPGGGYADCSRYNNGLRGGKVRIRAKIEKNDKKTLVIKELPYGKTTTSLIDSIISANDKGKIKIKKIDDNTAEEVEILIHLNAGVSPDKTIDALYAFTDCEISISPNACVIEEDKPHFLNVKEILEIATNNTVNLLRRELEIRKGELEENWHFLSLEKIFIDNKIYRDIEEAETHEDSVKIIHKKLKPHTKNLKREVTDDDVVRLMDIPIRRIRKFDRFKAEENLRAIEEEIKDIEHKIANIIDFTINYYKEIKKKYGKGKERKTELRSFDNIIATKVVATNEKLYVDKKEGFFGTGLKKEEYVCDCSDIDDIIVFLRNGKYMVTKVSEKSFAGKDIIHIAVFKKNDKRTIYHTVYRDGKYGKVYIKRFAVTSITRDKEYDVTKGTDNSKILYFSANPNGEAEVLKVYLKPRPKLRKLIFEYDIAELAIKGRNSQGNLLSRHEVHKVVMKEKGVSTLGGRKIWFDDAVFRLNTEERGRFLGTFSGTDKILVVTKSGYFRTTSYELANHYEDDIVYIEKLNDNKIFTAVYYEADQNYIYIKRFQVEDSEKEQSFIGSNEDSKLILITKHPKPLLELEFGGKHSEKENETIIPEEFIGVKSYKARGKRISSYEVKKVKELEPIEAEQEEPEEPEENIDATDNQDNTKDQKSGTDDGSAEQMTLTLE